MTSLGWTPGQLATFDRVTRTVTARGSGITARQLRDAGALARELAKDEPDVDRVALFLESLDLGPSDLEALTDA